MCFSHVPIQPTTSPAYPYLLYHRSPPHTYSFPKIEPSLSPRQLMVPPSPNRGNPSTALLDTFLFALSCFLRHITLLQVASAISSAASELHHAAIEAIRRCSEDSNASLRAPEFATMAANDFCDRRWHLPKVYMLAPLPLLAREQPPTRVFLQRRRCSNNDGCAVVLGFCNVHGIAAVAMLLCWASATSSVLRWMTTTLTLLQCRL